MLLSGDAVFGALVHDEKPWKNKSHCLLVNQPYAMMILKNLIICDHHIMTDAALIAAAIRLDGLARLPRTQPAWQVGIKPL